MHAHNVQTNQKHGKDKFNHNKRQVTCNKQYLLISYLTKRIYKSLWTQLRIGQTNGYYD